MSESDDLRPLLSKWPYDADNDARIVTGSDGRDILQVRTPLGIEQHEIDGRPDGARPHGMESFLEFERQRLAESRAVGREDEYELGPTDCDVLFSEATLYYFRYVRLFQLQDWERTLRDTTRNLKVFDLVKQYAEREEDKTYLERWRPYILRVHATAGAMIEVQRQDYEAAMKFISNSIQQIETLEDMEDETYQFEKERSLTTLRDLLDQISGNRPLTKAEQLERQLNRAIEAQEFEKAAKLRDRIKALTGPRQKPPAGA